MVNSYKRLILVYNPRSAHYAKVQDEVLSAARRLSGWMVGKYEIKPTSFDDNVQKMARLFDDDMLVIAAGGDGTATMTVNAMMISGKKAVFAALGYGNFNDVAEMLRKERSGGGTEAAAVGGDCEGEAMANGGNDAGGKLAAILARYERREVKTLYPLKIMVDGEHWRYAPAYFSAGLLAEATQLMEEPKVRKKLNDGRKSAWFSLRLAVGWYLKNHKRSFMPRGKLNGRDLSTKTTDYIAVNGPTLAGMMRGGQWWQEAESFGSTTQELGKFWKMVGFGLKSVRKGVPLEETRGDVLSFDEPSVVEVHSEGEFARLEKVQKIEVRKAGEGLRVIAG